MFAPRLPCGDQCPLEVARIFSQHLESIHTVNFTGCFQDLCWPIITKQVKICLKVFNFRMQRQCLNTCLWKLLYIKPFQQGEVTARIFFQYCVPQNLVATLHSDHTEPLRDKYLCAVSRLYEGADTTETPSYPNNSSQPLFSVCLCATFVLGHCARVPQTASIVTQTFTRNLAPKTNQDLHILYLDR